MATKDELLAFAQAHGVDVDSSMLKADIEAALSDAGYDPTTTGEDTVDPEQPRDEQSDVNPTTTPEDLEGTSSDAENSTYNRADQQREGEINPPPGPQTQQHRGRPEEAAE